MPRKIAVDIVVFLYILLLVYASVSKLLDYQKFSVQLGQSPMLTNYAKVLALLVPVVELIIACLLLLSKTRLIGLYAAYSLMVMFTTYIFIITTYDDYVPCSCGGILESMGWSGHLVLNIAFVLLAVIAIRVVEKQKLAVSTS
jgi:uncharacterized membrane protein YphA (DoxX/SURF4 family)